MSQYEALPAVCPRDALIAGDVHPPSSLGRAATQTLWRGDEEIGPAESLVQSSCAHWCDMPGRGTYNTIRTQITRYIVVCDTYVSNCQWQSLIFMHSHFTVYSDECFGLNFVKLSIPYNSENMLYIYIYIYIYNIFITNSFNLNSCNDYKLNIYMCTQIFAIYRVRQLL